jgi:hypothetical protein
VIVWVAGVVPGTPVTVSVMESPQPAPVGGNDEPLMSPDVSLTETFSVGEPMLGSTSVADTPLVDVHANVSVVGTQDVLVPLDVNVWMEGGLYVTVVVAVAVPPVPFAESV